MLPPYRGVHHGGVSLWPCSSRRQVTRHGRQPGGGECIRGRFLSLGAMINLCVLDRCAARTPQTNRRRHRSHCHGRRVQGTTAIRVVRTALRAARGMQLRLSKFDRGSAFRSTLSARETIREEPVSCGRMQHGGVDQRRVKPLRIHRLVQKVVCLGADLAPRRTRIGADEKRWNFSERAAEPFDGIDSGQSSDN